MKTMEDLYVFLAEKINPDIFSYRKKWKMVEDGQIEVDYPLHINFEINFGCNFKCDFCPHSIPYSKWGYLVKSNLKIPFDKYCKIIDEGVENGLCSVELNGINEPLLEKDIFKYSDYATKNGIIITSLHTNASLLNKKIAERILDTNISIISVSLDALKEETYKKIRKRNNISDVINNVVSLINMKKNRLLPLIRISFVENKINYKEKKMFNEFWKDKVDLVSFSSFSNPFVSQGKYSQIENDFRLVKDSFRECREPFLRLFIRNDGSVNPCCSFFSGEMCVGNIYDNSIYEIWNGNKINEIRKKITNNMEEILACQKCIKSKRGGVV